MEFDVDVIKLDRRSFTDVSREKTREVIRSVIELSHTIGAVTVAEGIETMEQLNFIREAGCDLVQGYIYAKPMPAHISAVVRCVRSSSSAIASTVSAVVATILTAIRCVSYARS